MNICSCDQQAGVESQKHQWADLEDSLQGASSVHAILPNLNMFPKDMLGFYGAQDAFCSLFSTTFGGGLPDTGESFSFQFM